MEEKDGKIRFFSPYIWKHGGKLVWFKGLSYMDPLMNAGTQDSMYMSKIVRTSFSKVILYGVHAFFGRFVSTYVIFSYPISDVSASSACRTSTQQQ